MVRYIFLGKGHVIKAQVVKILLGYFLLSAVIILRMNIKEFKLNESQLIDGKDVPDRKTIIVCNEAVQFYIQFFHIAENLLLSNDAFFHKQVGREGITRPGKSLVKVDFFHASSSISPGSFI